MRLRIKQWPVYCIYVSGVACCSLFGCNSLIDIGHSGRDLEHWTNTQWTSIEEKLREKQLEEVRETGGWKRMDKVEKLGRWDWRGKTLDVVKTENNGIMENRRLSSATVITGRRETTTTTRRAQHSRRPIKSSTGLDLSANEQQLLTFKVDERGRERRGKQPREARSILIAPLPFIKFRPTRPICGFLGQEEGDSSRASMSVPRCRGIIASENCWWIARCDIGSTMGKLIIVRLMGSKVDI